VHRVGQFFGHVAARVSADDADRAHRMLPPSARETFDAMPVADRRHGLDVAARLLDQGLDDPDLLAAALLHDGAKGRRMRLWHRVGGVLLEVLSPRLLARLASPDPQTSGYPWYLYLHHDELSAELARRVGLPERAVRFISGQVDPADARLAAALRRADDAS